MYNSVMIAKSRKEAIEAGLKNFTPDRACKNGHYSEHRVDGGCKKCAAERMAKKRECAKFRAAENKKKLQIYHERYSLDPEVIERRRAYREEKKNDEQFLARRRDRDKKYNKTPRAK